MTPSPKMCKKKFPIPFCANTYVDENNFLHCQRRAPEEGGFSDRVTLASGKTVDLNNAWVVEYNPALLLRLQCHVNVKKIFSQMGVNDYVLSYALKMRFGDRAALRHVAPAGENGNGARDEVGDFQAVRVVSSNSATNDTSWAIRRCSSFPM